MWKPSATCSIIIFIIHVEIIMINMHMYVETKCNMFHNYMYFTCIYNMLQKLLMKCEKGVKDHQIYRDTFMAASDWLSSMVDNLNLCSDVRGDRTVVEAQLHKLQVKKF